MPIDQIFIRPLVKEVAFEVRFPNLFFIENKIGDIQVRIMREFPESSLLLQKHFVVGPLGEGKEAPQPDLTQTIWQFKKPNGPVLKISRESLSLVSQSHSTYNQAGDNRFRDIIQLVCDNFFGIITIPLVNRIGLRYINHCPLSEKSSERVKRFYNSAIPFDRFKLEDAFDTELTAVFRRPACNMRYQEKIHGDEKNLNLMLDLDAWTENVESNRILETTDILHEAISTEFETFATDELLNYMKDDKAVSP